nr:flagellar motor switch phosphatase FliY [Sedimentibacter sp.]
MTNEIIFSDMEKDVIGEVMNISLGSSATSLSTLLGKRVEITVPKVDVIKAGQFSFEGLEPAIGAEIRYVEGLDGINLMILKRMDAKAIIEILMGQTIPDDEFQMDEISISAISEVMNQMMGSAATALADFLGKPINISTPITYEIENRAEFKNRYFNEEDTIVAVSFNLFIEDIINSEFINVMSLELSREIVSMFLKGTGYSDEENELGNKDEVSDSLEGIENYSGNSNDIKPEPEKNIGQQDDYNEPEYDEEEEEERIEEKPPVRKQSGGKIKTKQKTQNPVNVRPMKYENFDDYEEDLSQEQLSNLELIMSVPLEISVEIGKTKRQIKDILEFSPGTIVELDKQAGALVDIIVNGQMIARGEVVVVNDNFGVRISEIVKKDEIMKISL